MMEDMTGVLLGPPDTAADFHTYPCSVVHGMRTDRGALPYTPSSVQRVALTYALRQLEACGSERGWASRVRREAGLEPEDREG